VKADHEFADEEQNPKANCVPLLTPFRRHHTHPLIPHTRNPVIVPRVNTS
jgi:hypothetical protein